MIHILFNFNKFLKNIFFKSRNEDKANGSMRKCNFFIITGMGKIQKMMALRMRVMMWIMNLANSRLDLSLLATWGRGLYVGTDWLAFEEEVFDKGDEKHSETIVLDHTYIFYSSWLERD